MWEGLRDLIENRMSFSSKVALMVECEYEQVWIFSLGCNNLVALHLILSRESCLIRWGLQRDKQQVNWDLTNTR